MKIPLPVRVLVCLGFLAARAAAQLAVSSAVPAVNLTLGVPANVTPVTAAGGTAPYGFAVTPALPAGLTLDATTGTIAGTAASSGLTPPFIGYEGFGADLSRWGYDFHFDSANPNGLLALANGHLEFTKAAGAGSHARGWDGDPSSAASYRTADSYAQSWVNDLTVSHTFTTAANEFASYGVEVTDANGRYAALMVVNGGGIARVRAEGTGATAAETALPAGTTLTRLRLQWDAGAKRLGASYSTDGGAHYTLLTTFQPDTQWGAASTGGFFFEVFANSNAAAAIPSGAMWGDNFKLSASAPTTHTVTVTDAGAGSASAAFTLTVNPPALTATTAIATVPAVVGSAVPPSTPVTGAGGLVPYSYNVFPALPAGLTFDPVSGQVAGTPATGTATPLFAGADDFNTGSDAKWAYYFQQGTTNGALSFTNGRLDFSKGAGLGNYWLGWDGDPTTANSRTTASTATNWVADIVVTNTASSANEYYTIGFQAAGLNQWGAVALTNQNGVLSVIGDGANTTPVLVPATANTNVRLRLTWDATALVLKSYCSFDNGASYTLVRTYAPFTEWTAGSLNNGFFFEVIARSNSAAAIASGAMYADNFSVAATGPATSLHTVTVGDRVGTIASSTFKVIVRNPPVVTAISPANALPGTTVVLSGHDLAEATSVLFGTQPADFSYNATDGSLVATVPAGARSSSVVVITPAGSSAPVALTVPLTITSQPAHNVVTAGQATSLSVSVAGGAQGGPYTYQWRRDGTTITGATNAVYYVGSMSSADAGDYDVQVSDGVTTLTAGPAALRVATSAVWQWRNRLPTGADFNAVAYGAGRYVAVGTAGTIVTSTDGATWTPLSQQPPALFLNAAWNGTQFLIVGTNGNVLRSTDGLAWTQGNVGANVSLFGVAYGGGRWVATGFNAIYTSTDGATWTRQPVTLNATINAVAATPTGFIAVSSAGDVLTGDTSGANWSATQPLAGTALIDVAYANGTYVIGARTHVYTSTNGTSWTAATLPTSDPGIDWARIVFSNGRFTIAGASYVSTSPTPRGYVIQSTDGATWTLGSLPGVAGLQGIAAGPSGLVAVGLIGEIVTSADGASWTVASSGLRLAGDLFAGATGPAGSLFAGVGGAVFWSADHLTNWTRVSAGTVDSLYGATFAAGKYVIVGANDNPSAPAAVVLSSAAGASGWTKVDLTGASYLAALAYDGRVGRFVTAGDGGSLYWAADPAGPWTAVNKPAATVVRAGAAANGRYVLVGDNGTIFTSTDAATWTAATSGTTVSLQAVAYGNGRFVAAGSSTSAANLRTVIVTSVDGVTWQNVPVPFTGSIRGMTFADGRFITVGGTSTVLRSSDGLNWSAETSQFSGLFRAILRTPEGYLAGGTGGSIASVAAPKVTAGVTTQTITVGAAASFTAATAASGHGPYTYAVTPALPAGLALDPATGLVSGTPTAGAVALFAGGDDFTTGSDAKWAYYFRTAGAGTANGQLSFTNGRLDFSKGAGAGTYFLGWDGDADPATATARTTASFATSWVADLTVTNTYTAATNEYADVGLEVGGGSSQFSSILLLNRGGALFIRGNGSGSSAVETPVATGTAVRLRLAWDAGTKVLTASYSTDNGANYTTATTFTPATTWLAGTAAAGFYFEVFGESNAAAAIAPGSLYADDFGVRTTSPTTTIHTVTATDALGLTGTTTFGLTVLPAPVPVSITQAPVGTTAVVGTPASLSVTATGGLPITYQWLKDGTAIAGATSSTLAFPNPALADEGLYSVALTNAAGTVTTTAVQLTVNAAPVITQQPVALTAIVGTPATFSVAATGKPAVTYQWYKGATAVAGATNASLTFGAVQTGDAGTYSVKVANSVATVTSASVALTVNPPAPVITTAASAASAVSGRSFLFAITTSTTGATFGAIGLPAGLAVDAGTGVISGVPTATGTFTVTLQAANVTATTTKSLTLTVLPPPPIINSAASTAGRVNASFSYTIQAVNTPTTYGATGLPPGLAINPSTGAITGTPSTAGTYSVTLAATNAGGTTTTPLVLTIDPALNAPTYTGTSQLSGVQNSAFSFTPAFTTGGLTTTYSATGLPAGLTISSSTGAISGTPAATGTFTVNITATNTGGALTVPFTFTVNPPPAAPAITSASAAGATVGTPFNFTLTASGVPNAFSATGLPALGLSLNPSTGAITGTPTGPGTLTLAVNATNAAGTGPAAALVITVNPSPSAPILTNATVAHGRAGDAFSFSLTATNTPASFAVTSGALPAGLSLDPSSGAITGTPSQAGQFAAWIAASNGSGAGYALQVMFDIAPALTTPVITSNGTAAAQVGQPFSYQIAATNSPTSFAATGLPAGLSLDATSGIISGLPADATTTALAITLTATNASGTSTPKTLLLSVAAAAATPVITSPLTASGQVGAAFTYQITASNSPTSFVALNLPAGLALNAATGAISGTPVAAGSATITLRAANAGGLGAASTLVLNLAPAATAPAITSAAATTGKVGVAFSYAITTSGAATSYAASGALPLGLVLNTSTGVVSGTPAAAGIFPVTLSATGAGGTSLPQSVVFNISPADNVPVITSAIYASGTVGQTFTYQITAASTPAFPAAPFAPPFTLDAVNLPAGLAVNPSTGVIQGVPTTAGVFTATLVGTNSAGTGPYRDLTFYIAPAATAPVVTSPAYAAAQVGMSFSYRITATNSPTSFDVLGAPAWLTVNNTSGALAGVPTTPGTFTAQLVATNAAGSGAPVTLTITVAPAVNAAIVTSTRTATGPVSQPFSYQITAAVPNGAPAVTSYVATGLPAGLSLNAATGVISGTPTSSGQYEVTLIAVNSAGSSQPVTLILTIQPSLQFNGGS